MAIHRELHVLEYNDATGVTQWTTSKVDDIGNVVLTGIADGDMLYYDSGSLEWKNTPIFKSYSMQVYGRTTSVSTGTYKGWMVIPDEMDGWELSSFRASYGAAKGSSGTTDIQVVNWSGGAATDMLDTVLTMGDEWTVADGVIDTDNDDVSAGDVIYVDIDSARTGAQGLYVTLTFTLP